MRLNAQMGVFYFKTVPEKNVNLSFDLFFIDIRKAVFPQGLAIGPLIVYEISFKSTYSLFEAAFVV